MSYPPELKSLIQLVEKTRPARIERARRGESFTALSLAERQERLKRFHPDYRADAKRVLAVGPNRGDQVPVELADLLETRSRLDLDAVSLERIDIDTDVLIIGAGGAGTAAALEAVQAGASVVMATKLRHGDANTVMAEGGIQAATAETDSPCYHYLDVLGGGHFSNVPDLASMLVRDAPEAVEWLEHLGVLFDKYPDGHMKVRHGGGTSRKRLHSCGDMTGAEIMRVLRDEARNHRAIRVLEFTPAIELLLDGSGPSTSSGSAGSGQALRPGSGQARCAGAVLLNLETKEQYIVRAKAVILATGGLGRLHIQGFPCTNHYGATADGLVMAYRAGIETCFLDSTQFHPTGAVFPEQNAGLLITEKVRGLGAHLLNREGEEFLFSLEPRDVASACIIRECSEGGKGIPTPAGRAGVWLDSPMIDLLHGEGTVKRELGAKYLQFKRFGIDISQEPMLVYPTLHYQNGGLVIGVNSETSIAGLYAAGEVSGGIHGKNRLMGNSLLDVIVFGRRAGRAAAAYARTVKSSSRLSLDHVRRFENELASVGMDDGRVGPMLLPNYSPDHVRERRAQLREA
jgi:succinate dehydrogenase / fumarate reductase flavoprotein subunit/L-aspartate oxidase